MHCGLLNPTIGFEHGPWFQPDNERNEATQGRQGSLLSQVQVLENDLRGYL